MESATSSATLNLRQGRVGVAETIKRNAHFLHQGKVETTHLAVGLFRVAKDPTARYPTAPAAQKHNREVLHVVMAVKHAR